MGWGGLPIHFSGRGGEGRPFIFQINFKGYFMENTIFFLAMFAILVWYLISSSRDRAKAEAAYLKQGLSLHCMDCGNDFKPPMNGALRGSTLVEIALWFTLAGGLIYSIWRRSGSFKPECPDCHSNKVVPIASRAAIAHIKSLS